MEQKKLKIYSPSEYNWVQGILAQYPNKKLNTELLEYTTFESCDYVLSPWVWWNQEENQPIIDLCEEAKKHNKQVLIFFIMDFVGNLVPPIPENGILFSTWLFKSKQKLNQFVMPAMIDLNWFPPKPIDQLIRKKSKKPIVGFCGDALYPNKKPGLVNHIKRAHKILTYSLLANPKLDKSLQTIGIHLTNKEGTRARVQSLIPVKKSKDITANFIIRDNCFNGVTYDGSPEDEALKRQSRVEYIDNMLASDYILCPRGDENYSIRFYETLSCGRIPVFINTDCVLPYENIINWKDYCIWVEQDDIANINDIINDFHNSLSEEEFIQKQKDCHKLWNDYLSPEGFFRNFYRHFE